MAPATIALLQRQAGNKAVQGLIQRHRDSRLSVQRCGGKACDCSPAERAAHEGRGPAEEGAAQISLQRFGSDEHVRIGDEALPGQNVLITAYGRITFGEMIALGDFFGSVREIESLAARGRFGRDQIDYALWKVNPVSGTNPTGRARPRVGQDVIDAVDNRYYRLAARNEAHFSTGSAPGESNRERYIAGHTEAIRSAFYEGISPLTVRPSNWQAQEAFAQHFLTDAFSGGHIRTPRGEITRHWQGLYPSFPDNLVHMISCHMAAYINERNRIGWVATVGMLTDAIAERIRAMGGAMLSSFSIGDLISKVMHDADNAGLDVVSQTGPGGATGPVRWRAVGDDFLFPATPNAEATQTQEMVKEAARLSFEEGRRAYSAGLHGGATLTTLTDPTNFRALALIPQVDPASTANPTFSWRAPSIAALPPNIRDLIADAFANGEVRHGIDSMAVPPITTFMGFDLHTGEAWDCFKGLLLADPLGMIERIGAGNTCPAGNNSPCRVGAAPAPAAPAPAQAGH